MSHSHLTEVHHNVPDTTDLVVGFDAGIAVVEPRQTEEAEPIQSFYGGTKTGGTSGQ